MTGNPPNLNGNIFTVVTDGLGRDLKLGANTESRLCSDLKLDSEDWFGIAHDLEDLFNRRLFENKEEADELDTPLDEDWTITKLQEFIAGKVGGVTEEIKET